MHPRVRWLMALTIGLALTLAGCQMGGEPAAEGGKLHPEYTATLSSRTQVGTLDDPAEVERFTWDHDGPVDIYGTGMGTKDIVTQNPATIVIPDVGSVVAVRVQVALKFTALDQVAEVEFRNGAGDVLAKVEYDDSSPVVSGDFFETVFFIDEEGNVDVDGTSVAFDGTIVAEVMEGTEVTEANLDQITTGLTEWFTPRSFVAFVLREPTMPATRSLGATPYVDIWYTRNDDGYLKSHAETLTFDAATEPRPLRIQYAMAELEPDTRPIDVKIEVDGAVVYDERFFNSNESPGDPDFPDELLIDHIDTVLPAGATDVTITVASLSRAESGEGRNGDSVWLSGFNASVTEPPDEPGFEGCTPGYWRNHTGLGPGRQANAWEDTGFEVGDRFGDVDVFDRVITIMWASRGRPGPVSNPTLLQSVEAQGGGVSALARHAVAALLNAAHPDVDSPYTVDDVVKMVQDALDGGDIEGTKDMLEWANELGCPL